MWTEDRFEKLPGAYRKHRVGNKYKRKDIDKFEK